MSALVLIVGALMLAAGGYEMVAGSGDILSERGWSAYIAGAVLVAGGVVTMALGLALRALDRLRGAIAAAEGRRGEPAPRPGFEKGGDPGPAGVRDPVMRPAAGPSLEPAPMIAAPPIEHAGLEEPYAAPLAVVPVAAAMAEPVVAYPVSAPRREPARSDWDDTRFADLEREMALPPEPAAPELAHAAPESPPEAAHIEPAHVAEPHPVTSPEPLGPASIAPHDDAPHDDAPHNHEIPDDAPRENALRESEPEPVGNQATVSAREEPVPPPSPVIGRYESEGTSYVMYADGSIDAQSEAGVYRFASMAELKAFIES